MSRRERVGHAVPWVCRSVAATVLPLIGGVVGANEIDKRIAEPTDSAGLSWTAAYTADYWRNTHGGLRVGDRYLDNLDLIAGWTGEQLRFGGRRRAHVHVLRNNSSVLSEDLIGDLQVVSNIDTPDAWRLYEAWFETPLGSGGSVRMGLYDLNSEFDALETASLFLNSSHGIGAEISQSGANGPSIFPVTSLGIRLEWAFSERVLTRLVVLDAVPGNPNSRTSNAIRVQSSEGALLVGEIEASIGNDARAYGGAWHYTKEALTLAADTRPEDEPHAPATGIYVGVEKRLSEATRMFGRIGSATSRPHPIKNYVGLGASWRLPTSTAAVVGFAIAHARLSDEYREFLRDSAGGSRSTETTLELTARFEFARGGALQPDIQYVHSPGGERRIADALAVGLRFEWQLSNR